MKQQTELLLELDRLIVRTIEEHWAETKKPLGSKTVYAVCLAAGYPQAESAVRYRLNRLRIRGTITAGKMGYLPKGARRIKEKDILRVLDDNPQTTMELSQRLNVAPTRIRSQMRLGETLQRSEGTGGRPVWWAAPEAEKAMKAQLAFEQALLERIRDGETVTIIGLSREEGVDRSTITKRLAWLFAQEEIHIFGCSLRLGPAKGRPTGEAPAQIRELLSRGSRSWTDYQADMQEAGFSYAQAKNVLNAMLKTGEVARPSRGTYCLASDAPQKNVSFATYIITP